MSTEQLQFTRTELHEMAKDILDAIQIERSRPIRNHESRQAYVELAVIDAIARWLEKLRVR